MKKVLSIILSICMLLSITAGLDFSAYANTSGKCGENVYYDYDSSTGTLTISGTGDMYDYNLSWGDDRFLSPLSYVGGLKTININNGVTSIGNCSFCSNENVNNISLPNSIRRIGSTAFSGCTKLSYIYIPNYVNSIGDYAFNNCFNLSYINIPNGVNKIGNCAFNNCSNLSYVTLPNSILNIGSRAFYGCHNLNSVVLPNSLTNIGDCAFNNCSSLKGVSIPNSVRYIGPQAFSGTGITNFTFPNKVTTIYPVLQNCNNLKTVVIPSSAKYIADGAFKGCNNLTSVNIPKSVTRIENNAFSGCTKVKIKGYTGSYAQTFCKWTGIPFVALDVATPKLNKVTSGKKQFTAKWSKVSGAGGYEIKYSLKKNMKSSKTVKAGKSATSKKVKSLKSKKTYYVQIRAYKTVNGKKQYSKWSAKKKVKTK